MAIALVGCGLLPPVGGDTFEEGTESVPGPGYFHGIGDPTSAEQSLIVGSFGEDGVASHVTSSFSKGDTIEFEGTGFAGWRGLTANGSKCEGRIPLTTNMVTEVVLHHRGATCEVTVSSVHPVVGG
jgi:hypothetical protein